MSSSYRTLNRPKLNVADPINLVQQSVSVKENMEITRAVNEINRLRKINLTSKILVIFACHSDSELKMRAIRSNLTLLMNNPNLKICVINSVGTQFSENVKKFCEYFNLQHIEVENSGMYDFGKWYDALKIVDCSPYDYITFTNDSVFFYTGLKPYFNAVISKNKDLFGYNDAVAPRYHYQSYLFSIKSSAINRFLTFIDEKRNEIKNQLDAIEHYEIRMTDYFPSNDCLLHISRISTKPSNIFFTNDDVYIKLFRLKLLPFAKIKRIQTDPSFLLRRIGKN